MTGSLPMTIPTISIHALLAESDPPLPPAGGGRQISIHALLAESDDGIWSVSCKYEISIHALLAESDPEGEEDI